MKKFICLLIIFLILSFNAGCSKIYLTGENWVKYKEESLIKTGYPKLNIGLGYHLGSQDIYINNVKHYLITFSNVKKIHYFAGVVWIEYSPKRIFDENKYGLLAKLTNYIFIKVDLFLSSLLFNFYNFYDAGLFFVNSGIVYSNTDLSLGKNPYLLNSL